MNISTRSISAYIFLIFSFVISGCLTKSQQPSHIFANKLLPKALEEKANPKVDVPFRDNQQDKITIAVIDNGVDYTNRLLKNRVHYTRDAKGEIIGVGYDVLGKDNYAHPNLIDGGVFSFGARDIKDQKIVDPFDQPIQLLLDLNQEFVQNLIENIKSTRGLSSSVFARSIGEQSISLVYVYMLLKYGNLSAENLLESRKLYIEKFKDQNIAKPCLEYIKLSDLKKKKCVKELKMSLGIAGFKRAFHFNPWVMGTELGFPIIVDLEGDETLMEFYYFPEFLQAIERAYKEVAEDFEEAYESYYKYHFERSSDGDESRKKLDGNLMKDIHRYIYNGVFGYSHMDPIKKYRFAFCQQLTEEEYDFFHSKVTNQSSKEKFVKNKVKSLFAIAESVDTYLLERPGNSLKDKKRIEEQLRSYPRMKIFLTRSLLNRDVKELSCEINEEKRGNRFWKRYTEFFEKAHSTYLSKTSHSQSHGTHVAGVIAAQSSNIEILPVRVVTSALESINKENEQTFVRTMEGLKQWLQHPAVKAMIINKYSSAFNITDGTTDGTTERIYSLLYGELEINRDENILNYMFINQMIDAIRYVGEEKVKIANMSLGTAFSKKTRSAGDGPEPTLEEAVTSLGFEFLKYKVGKAIQSYAKNTLFVIAAGNNGNWIDGISRSALPCDVSSPTLKSYSDLGEVPNNQLDNILCVGSVSAKGEFSAFTNILLTETPMIFATGEAIQSTMKETDCTGANQIYSYRLGEDPKFSTISLYNKNDKQMLIDLGWHKESNSEMDAFIKQLNSRLLIEMPNLISTGKQHFCLRRYNSDARLSGTSMASPGVAGFIGAWLLDKMKSHALTQEDIWHHQDYKPKKIISRITAESPSLGNKLLKAVRVKGLKSYKSLLETHNEDGLKENQTRFIIFN